MKKLSAAYLRRHNSFICALLIIIVGIFVRVAGFGSVPGGLNQDEAFAGYEAFSLLHYGVDSAGYRNPSYLVTWGSGMSVLESFLSIPFMKMFGCSVVIIRLPQLLSACISLPVFYLLLKRMFSVQTALLGLSLLAVSPWHIMLSRWGIDCNLAPAFLLLGFYFFVKGIPKNQYWLLSALMYGIALYAYSITWIVVPVTLSACGVYILLSRRTVLFRYVFAAGAILLILALPHILFLLVNKGVLPEISTRFLSIPKLAAMRASEVSVKNLISPQSYYNLLKILIRQEDGLPWNAVRDFGLFYPLSLPFTVLGAVKLVAAARANFRNRSFGYEAVVLLGLFSSVLTCLFISNLNINKANSLYFYILTLTAVGLKEFFTLCKSHPIIPKAVMSGYALAFSFFCSFYFGSYNEQISSDFRAGLGDAVQYVKTQGYTDVCVDRHAYYSQILFYDQTPHSVYRNTVKYSNYPSAFLEVEEFGRYKFGVDTENLGSHEAYIIKRDARDLFLAQGYQIVDFENFSVAHQ